jgi:hypothetical protein
MPNGKKHTAEQVVAMLRRVEQGEAAEAVCRNMNISEATLYRRKQQHGAMELGQREELLPYPPGLVCAGFGRGGAAGAETGRVTKDEPSGTNAAGSRSLAGIDRAAGAGGPEARRREG